ncbi:subtilisin-like protease SBT1.4 [Papaver somniferum]|uniref:subtilisin-like protease SBT1.4 n=1 Tax=Papaver somniferum TaxID=3469 RepID=UPI000E6F7C96|nr:subtilisin-like protease SBT1.4 [Papaver somniferum]
MNSHKLTLFIIYISKLDKPSIFPSHLDWYTSALQSFPAHLSLLSNPREVIIYTYNHVTHGFAARLTQSQASFLSSFPGILSVLPQTIHKIQTTQTPSFLGLNNDTGLWPESDYASDIIIGVLDTGVWPQKTSCNKKIIGARAYSKGVVLNGAKDTNSPRDTEGNGTHTASTAAGSVVKNAGFNEYGVGDAQGMATKARIAIYKVCWSSGCADADLIAVMDQAVADGVDVISYSIGPDLAVPYDKNPISIAAFGAVEKRVLVSVAAGNEGPGPSTAKHLAPWILTVGASTIDIEYPCNVILGDDRIFGGVSLYSGKPLANNTELLFGGDIGSANCVNGVLNSTQAAGKIVLCDPGNIVEQENAVKIAGGVGLITANLMEYGYGMTAESPMIPGAKVAFDDVVKIVDYSRTQEKPVASFVFRGTVIGSSPSYPKVASFSSRGPNHITPEILKPDVIAPGVDILAAWTGAADPSGLDVDKRRVAFNIIYGTSMACPHVSGVAAMLRKAHPEWSPSAIKSAMLTTWYLYHHQQSLTAV